MNTKSKILNAIRQNKPTNKPLPVIPVFEKKENLIAIFKTNLKAAGSKLVADDYTNWLAETFPNTKQIASPIEGLGNVDLTKIKDPKTLKNIDIAILKGQIGVAENGAIWVDEADCGHRVLPFITQHLLVLLPKEKIVATMHDAYQQITINQTGFGVFISGPSKTADIEQSLVIGAQGARSLWICLV